jgi:uncharacterized membrane protein
MPPQPFGASMRVPDFGSLDLHYFPVPAPVLAVLAGLLVLAAALIILNAVSYAYQRMGVSRSVALLLMLASLLGSYVNLPLVQFPEAKVLVLAQPGQFYVVPAVRDWPGTVLAVNVGGALIPLAVSAFLVARKGLLVPAFFCTVFVAAVVHLLARPIPGLGIAAPLYAAPLAAVAAALVASRSAAAALAYVGGSLGTLVGGDLLNLRLLLELGSPVVSIGGAGMFDGIFVSALLALLLACLATERLRRPPGRA